MVQVDLTVVLLVAAGLSLAGCGQPSARVPLSAAPKPVFTPPSTAAASIYTRSVIGSISAVVDQVGSALQDRGFVISHFDLEAGEVVAEYQGEPLPFVDCGWLVLFAADGTSRQVPAATSLVDLGDGSFRELVLNARLLAKVFTTEGKTWLRGEGTYVLIETIEGIGAQPISTSLAQFQSGSMGSFSDGALCRPTGELERLPSTFVPGAQV